MGRRKWLVVAPTRRELTDLLERNASTVATIRGMIEELIRGTELEGAPINRRNIRST